MKAELQAIRELISNPECWTRDAMARNADGDSITPRDPAACQWCLLGAARKVCSTIEYYDIVHLWNSKIPAHFNSVEKFNDVSSHAQVLVFLDGIIENYEL